MASTTLAGFIEEHKEKIDKLLGKNMRWTRIFEMIKMGDFISYDDMKYFEGKLKIK